ncbi:MAG TPA: hypothetical protein PK914_03375, partial [Smithellaceae bacterium]|nr:hypothetical protein [Smithellaceae bacterium]
TSRMTKKIFPPAAASKKSASVSADDDVTSVLNFRICRVEQDKTKQKHARKSNLTTLPCIAEFRSL